MIWTEDQVAQLKKLRADGLSAAAIAARIDPALSRSAVFGKLNRLGLLNSTGAPRAKKVITARSATGRRGSSLARAPAVYIPRESVLATPMGKDGVTLLDLKPGDCRRPLWPDNARLSISQKYYCAAPTDGLGAWCKACHGRLYVPLLKPVRRWKAA